MHRPTPPLPKGGGFASGKTGGIPQACRFPHRFVLLGKCLLWNPSVTAKATGGSPAVPAPFNKGAFFIRYRSMVRYRAFTGFQSTAWEIITPKIHKLKRVQRPKPTTRAKAKGQSPDGSPLKPDNFPFFLAGARKEGPAGKHLQKADWRTDSKVITVCR